MVPPSPEAYSEIKIAESAFPSSLRNMSTSLEEPAPLPGNWPVDPQEDTPISEDRVWVDGCFDFSHHGEKSIPSIQHEDRSIL